MTTGVDPDHLTAVLCALQEAGCRVETGAGEIRLTCYSPLEGYPPSAHRPHPGFPTDAQAILMAALAGGTGSTMFVENIFSSRYHHVDELSRMGLTSGSRPGGSGQRAQAPRGTRPGL